MTPRCHVGARSRSDTRGIEFRIVPYWDDGYQLEVKLPWNTLGVRPSEGVDIGIDLHINDDDDGGPRDSKRTTYAAVDDAWERPISLGRMVLRPAGAR